jgi:hypothetical protein
LPLCPFSSCSSLAMLLDNAQDIEPVRSHSPARTIRRVTYLSGATNIPLLIPPNLT